jgi:hypothetical protein
MKALNAAYKSQRGVDKNTVYLFVMNRGSVGGNHLAGDMPRGSQFGYLFKSGQDGETLNRTVAHELAHGRFKLRHTFDSDYGKLVTDNNLMDYSGGVHLAKWQWDMLFDPALLVSPFEGDEDAMALNLKWVKDKIKEILKDASVKTGYALLTAIINGIYIDNFTDWNFSKWSVQDIQDAMNAIKEYLRDMYISKLMKGINRIMAKHATNSEAALLMDMTNLSWIENLQTKDIPSAASLTDRMIISNKDAATVIFGLLFEFKYGIGPEIREFGEGSVMTSGVKDFYLVEQGREFFYKLPARKQFINNLSELYNNPVKIKDKTTKDGAFFPDFGLSGIPQAGWDLVKQYIGGFYMEMLPDKEGKNMDMILYNDVNLKSLVLHYLDVNELTEKEIFPEKYPRQQGKVTPLGETQQILRWKEKININRLK